MGIEYSLRFEAPDDNAVADMLRQFPGVREVTTPDHRFDFREGLAHGEWPHATVMIEPGGAYFCDYGGGHAVLGLVVASLASYFGPVTVAEL